MKIAVLGMGGIGGVVGGALAKNFDDIYFIARGKSLEAIKNNGLTVESDKLGTFNVKPAGVTEKVEEIGVVDVLIIATKSYGLEGACKQCAPIIDKNTVVIPLLNGVAVSDEAEAFLNNAGEVADGCIYAFSSLEEPGRTKHIGELCHIDFGFKDGRTNEKCVELAKMLNKSGIETVFSNDIMVPVWVKYIMMCGNSAVFSYFECSADVVHQSAEKMKYIEDVYTELYKIGKAKGVNLPNDVVEKHMAVFKNLPVGAITSLYRDLKQPENKTEFEAVIGKGIKLAKETGVEVPCLNAVYEKYKGR